MAEAVPELAQWLPQARAGSREALGKALEACRGYLLVVANRQLQAELQPKGGPSDLVQETFLEAQRDFAQFHGESGDELLAWLRQLLLHNLANFRRRYHGTGKRQLGREVAMQSETPSGLGDLGSPGVVADTPSPSKKAIAREQVEALEGALPRLPEDYRQVITYRYREGLSFAEIAARLGRSENAIRKLWFRALEQLQQEMDRSP
jgi:RNA polymerase sigma-70 factor (ECF subfamily)